jgi:hypothetical protein
MDWHDAVVIVAKYIEQAEKSPDTIEERYRDALLAREIAETAHAALLLHRKQHYSQMANQNKYSLTIRCYT